jgi:hypothetical protein
VVTEREYKERIQTYQWADLEALWKAIQARETEKEWDAGKAFEYLIIRAFELEGADVKYPFSVNHPLMDNKYSVEQIDGIVYSDGLSCLMECKDVNGDVNVEPLTKLRSQIARRPNSTLGILLSGEGFTEPAKLLAYFMQPQTILLWTGEEVAFALQKRFFRKGLLAKYRNYVEYSYPDHNISVEIKGEI